MDNFTSAKCKRELEHGRLRCAGEPSELFVNDLIDNPDVAGFADVKTGLEDLQSTLVKVLEAQAYRALDDAKRTNSSGWAPAAIPATNTVPVAGNTKVR